MLLLRLFLPRKWFKSNIYLIIKQNFLNQLSAQITPTPLVSEDYQKSSELVIVGSSQVIPLPKIEMRSNQMFVKLMHK